ncbi:MAG: dephospho-CoA kinase [Peptoniphilus grossensis]|uniref:dephospho-CoA kinase n=1 Tax=Peptoniphilus grossensis TaxID=1465756 RepID=UPI00291489EB|nr:dephospho-CoA kinase [Peptoniphilus grossensis]MDU7151142.1 dephospho-CoA kinase [Peptoniphilus grossensis]
MNQSKIIGLTGSIATGKSQVSNYLRDKGIKVVDADLIARDVANYKSVKNKIKKAFGDDLYINDQLDRKKLAEIIFANKIHRQKLNGIMHPEIYKEINKKTRGKEDLVFVDIPLLFENEDVNKKYGLEFDEIWLVYVDRETQIKRLMNRDDISRDYAEKKINSQIPVEEKRKKANVIIDNSGTLEETFAQVEENLKK